MLARRVEEIRQASVFGIRPVRIFREAATRFLEENSHLATLRTYAFHLKELDPYIGLLPLYQVHMGTLQAYIDKRKKEGKKNKTVNGALATVRRVLNLSARLWRDGEVCSLQWDWEIGVPELGTSVFLIPGAKVKNREDRLVVLNRVAKSVIDDVCSINNNSWKTVLQNSCTGGAAAPDPRCRRPVGS